MVAASLVVAVATIVGLVLLWPHGKLPHPKSITSQKTIGAKVTRVSRVRCAIAGAAGCKTIEAEITQGRDKGRKTKLLIVGTAGFGDVSAGDLIRVFATPPLPPGTPAAVRTLPPYSFADFDRRMPMLWLTIGFAVLLVASGRLHGLRALVGLAASLLI